MDRNILGGSKCSKILFEKINSLDNLIASKVFRAIINLHNDFLYNLNMLNQQKDLNHYKFMTRCLRTELKRTVLSDEFLPMIRDDKLKTDMKSRILSIIKYKITESEKFKGING